MKKLVLPAMALAALALGTLAQVGDAEARRGYRGGGGVAYRGVAVRGPRGGVAYRGAAVGRGYRGSATMVAEATACRWQWAPSVLLPSELQQRAATTATDIPLTAIPPTDTLPAILTSRHARGSRPERAADHGAVGLRCQFSPRPCWGFLCSGAGHGRDPGGTPGARGPGLATPRRRGHRTARRRLPSSLPISRASRPGAPLRQSTATHSTRAKSFSALARRRSGRAIRSRAGCRNRR